MKTGQAKDQSRVENLITETKRMQTQVNDLRSQINDLEGRNAMLERQYNDLLKQHEEVRQLPRVHVQALRVISGIRLSSSC